MDKALDRVLLAVVLTLSSAACVECAPSKTSEPGVRQRMIIDASPQSVWEAVRNPASCPDNRRVVSVGDKEAVFEETFDNIPFFHSSKCVFHECELPLKRIDYKLVQSSCFKDMGGSWILTPTQDGRTLLEASAYLDTGLRIPFAGMVANYITTKHIKQRLSLVKTMAETAEKEKNASTQKSRSK